jgi:hypothetical protein
MRTTRSEVLNPSATGFDDDRDDRDLRWNVPNAVDPVPVVIDDELPAIHFEHWAESAVPDSDMGVGVRGRFSQGEDVSPPSSRRHAC